MKRCYLHSDKFATDTPERSDTGRHGKSPVSLPLSAGSAEFPNLGIPVPTSFDALINSDARVKNPEAAGFCAGSGHWSQTVNASQTDLSLANLLQPDASVWRETNAITLALQGTPVQMQPTAAVRNCRHLALCNARTFKA